MKAFPIRLYEHEGNIYAFVTVQVGDTYDHYAITYDNGLHDVLFCPCEEGCEFSSVRPLGPLINKKDNNGH